MGYEFFANKGGGMFEQYNASATRSAARRRLLMETPGGAMMAGMSSGMPGMTGGAPDNGIQDPFSILPGSDVMFPTPFIVDIDGDNITGHLHSLQSLPIHLTLTLTLTLTVTSQMLFGRASTDRPSITAARGDQELTAR